MSFNHCCGKWYIYKLKLFSWVIQIITFVTGDQMIFNLCISSFISITWLFRMTLAIYIIYIIRLLCFFLFYFFTISGPLNFFFFILLILWECWVLFLILFFVIFNFLLFFRSQFCFLWLLFLLFNRNTEHCEDVSYR